MNRDALRDRLLRARGRRPRTGPWATAQRLAVLALIIVALDVWGTDYYRSVAVTVLITAVAAVALTVLMGWVGQPSVMTSAVVLAGGYGAAVLGSGAHLPFLLVVLLSLPIGAFLGWLISLPSRRLSGLYQLLATLAFFYVITNLGNQFQSSRGVLGGYILPTANVLGASITSNADWLTVSGVVLALVVEYFLYLRTTRIGRAWVLIRENRDAAEVAGIPVPQLTSLAFALTTGVQFASGVLLAYELRTVSYDTVTLVASVSFIVMIVLGGMGSIVGAIVGAAVVIAIPPVIETSFGNGSGGGGFLITHLTAVEGLIYAVVAAIVLLRIDRRVFTRVRRSFPRSEVPTPATSGRLPGPSTVGSGARHRARRPDEDQPDDGSNLVVRLEGVSVRYGGGEAAVHDIGIDVGRRGATALVGRNGAGKTTVLGAIGGFVPSVPARMDGHALFYGAGGPVALDRLSPMQRSRLGVAYVPAEEKIFGGLTVHEQIREALAVRRSSNQQAAFDEVFDLFPDLRKLEKVRAGLLSGGERQQLAIATAVASRPKLLLIDEASLGLSPALVAAVTALLIRIRDEGVCALMLAEQNPRMAFEVADHVLLIEDGTVKRQGPPSPDLMDALELSYLGTASPGTVR